MTKLQIPYVTYYQEAAMNTYHGILSVSMLGFALLITACRGNTGPAGATTATATAASSDVDNARQALIAMAEKSNSAFLKSTMAGLSEPIQPGGYAPYEYSIGGWELDLKGRSWIRATRNTIYQGKFVVDGGHWTAVVTFSNEGHSSVPSR